MSTPMRETAISNALQIFDDIDDEVGRAFAFNSMGIVMQVSCNAVKAHHYFTQALRLNSDMGDTVGQAGSLAGLACSLLLRSQFAEAKVAVEEALALRAPHVNPDHLHLLGRVWIALAQYDEAEKVLTLSKDLHEEMGNVLGSSDDNLYLAHISLWRGKLEVVKNFKNDAKFGYEQEGSLVGLADTLVLDGILRLREPNLPAAHTSFEQALELYVKIRCPLGQAVGLYRLGIYFLRAANFERAVGSFQEALRFHTQTGNIQGQAGDLNKISEVYLRQGSIQEALTKISDALAMHVQIGDVAGQGDDVYIQARVFLQESRFDDAEKTIRKALDLHTQAGDVYGQARDTATLGSILWWQFRKGREDEKPDDKHIQLQNRDLRGIEEAKQLFARIGANGEAQECEDEVYF
jgi:tetratricopeptide (TPR) repeat protein